jgi:hypothetical protein
MPESEQSSNIRISVNADEILERLTDLNLFEDAISAYRAAMCLAISLDLPVDTTIQTPRNKWDTAAVFRNPTTNVEDVLLLMGVPRAEIVARGRFLAEAGLRYLQEKISANSDLLSILIPGVTKSVDDED